MMGFALIRFDLDFPGFPSSLLFSRWPQNIVPYVLRPSIRNNQRSRQLVEQSMKEWQVNDSAQNNEITLPLISAPFYFYDHHLQRILRVEVFEISGKILISKAPRALKVKRQNMARKRFLYSIKKHRNGVLRFLSALVVETASEVD